MYCDSDTLISHCIVIVYTLCVRKAIWHRLLIQTRLHTANTNAKCNGSVKPLTCLLYGQYKRKQQLGLVNDGEETHAVGLNEQTQKHTEKREKHLPKNVFIIFLVN